MKKVLLMAGLFFRVIGRPERGSIAERTVLGLFAAPPG